MVEGPFDLNVTGVISSFTPELAQAGISIFVIATFDTDYLLVTEKNLAKAIEVLERAGHSVRQNGFRGAIPPSP